jgi:hypothetical protein
MQMQIHFIDQQQAACRSCKERLDFLQLLNQALFRIDVHVSLSRFLCLFNALHERRGLPRNHI